METATQSLETILADAVANALKTAYPDEERLVTLVTINSPTPGNAFVLIRTKVELPVNVTIQIRVHDTSTAEGFADFLAPEQAELPISDLAEDAAWTDVEEVTFPTGLFLEDVPGDELCVAMPESKAE